MLINVFNPDFQDFIKELVEISDTLSVRVLSLQDLIMAKKSAGRPKDLDDLEQLSID